MVSHVKQKVSRIWVIVANPYIMQIFRKHEGNLEKIREARVQKSAGICNTDFAQEIGILLEDAMDNNAFDHIILASSPDMRGEFRKSFSNKVSMRIVAEVSTDLTKIDDSQLNEEINKILWF